MLPYLPWPLLPIYPFLSFPLDLNPAQGLGPPKGVAGAQEVHMLGEGELPGGEGVEAPPPPVVKPLPSLAISGLTINPAPSPLEIFLATAP